ASLADARRMSASISGGTSWRTLEPTGAAQASLRGTRFPALVIAGPVTPRIVVGGGFATYLDRTFGVRIQDTINLRGVQEPITDHDLPLTYGTGVLWRAGTQASLAGTVTWRNWATSGAGADSTVHDTFNWSVGAEIGSLHTPIRLGVRGGQLPFGIGKTPSEV